MKGEVLPVCFVCREVPETGFAAGIFLFKKFICEQCQEKILEITSNDEDYQLILDKIRQLWSSYPREKNKLTKQI